MKFPFTSGYFDTLGHWISDSIVRDQAIVMLIYRGSDSLMQTTKTDHFGVANFLFDVWDDGTQVDTSNIEGMDIMFPLAERVTRIGSKTIFEPLIYKNIEFKTAEREILIILPLIVVINEYTIGYGPFRYSFAIMADMHIAAGKTNGDFGSDGYDDFDDNPNETTYAIQNNENIIAKINQLMGPGYDYPIKFVVCLGDMSVSSERSEYQRAKAILQNLEVPWIPVFGNHDTWPYVGSCAPWGYVEQPSNEVIIGQYFYSLFCSQFDSLRDFLPISNWRESPLLSSYTYITGQGYPSHY